MTPAAFTAEELTRMRAGQPVQMGKHRYLVCPTCGKIVCLTKRLLGSLHVCAGASP